MRYEPFDKRFWSRVQKSETCWTWTGAATNAGYGKIYLSGRIELAHRALWMTTVGPIPDGMFVLHRCDNPRCVRPSHLFLGTHQDNVDDMRAKGRHQHGLRNGRYTKPESILRGEANGSSKLTQFQVDEIRRRYAKGGISQRKLADEYGVKQQAVSKIIKGLRWGSPKMKYS